MANSHFHHPRGRSTARLLVGLSMSVEFPGTWHADDSLGRRKGCTRLVYPPESVFEENERNEFDSEDSAVCDKRGEKRLEIRVLSLCRYYLRHDMNATLEVMSRRYRSRNADDQNVCKERGYKD